MLLVMRRTLPTLAAALCADARTLRRAVARGTVRCRRPGPRQLALSDGELAYLHGHWPTLDALSRALRTEPNVRLAVLYGSVARGDDRQDSDVDLLVDLREDTGRAALRLMDRLERGLGRPVDIARLPRVRRTSPLLLLQALDEGRVLVDRDATWPVLRAERDRVAADAARVSELEAHAAADALAALPED